MFTKPKINGNNKQAQDKITSKQEQGQSLVEERLVNVR